MLLGMMEKIREQPEEAKFRRIRAGNLRFRNILGANPNSSAVLAALGFNAMNEAGEQVKYLAIMTFAVIPAVQRDDLARRAFLSVEFVDILKKCLSIPRNETCQQLAFSHPSDDQALMTGMLSRCPTPAQSARLDASYAFGRGLRISISQLGLIGREVYLEALVLGFYIAQSMLHVHL